MVQAKKLTETKTSSGLKFSQPFAQSGFRTALQGWGTESKSSRKREKHGNNKIPAQTNPTTYKVHQSPVHAAKQRTGLLIINQQLQCIKNDYHQGSVPPFQSMKIEEDFQKNLNVCIQYALCMCACTCVCLCAHVHMGVI